MNATRLYALRSHRDAVDTRPMVFPACEGGPCANGTKPCPSPAACRLPEPAPKRHALFERLFGWMKR